MSSGGGVGFAKCDRCSYERLIGVGLRSYVISKEQKLTIRQEYAFCKRCSEAVIAEYIPSLEELNAELATFTTQNNEEWVADTRSYLDWRRTRVSPPRCLECGSTDIVYFRIDETDDDDDTITLEHPNCGGLLSIHQPLVGDRLWILYTPEGEKLARYEMFPSRGAVKID